MAKRRHYKLFIEVARQIQSRFFTMDIAQRSDGEWMIVELGDAQVAGLPRETEAEDVLSCVEKSSG